MLTPEYLTEIERKARACQAEEAANPDAKTCQRPTPELVLRLVEDTRENKRHWDAAISLCVKKAKEKAEMEDDYEDQLKTMTKDMDSWKKSAETACKNADELRAKVAELQAIVDRLIQIPKKYDNMRRIEYEQNTCASMRKSLDALGDGSFGIAVGKDEYAKRWQALDAEREEIKKFISESFSLAAQAQKGGAQ